MPLLQIDVEARDGDGNVASDSVAVPVSDGLPAPVAAAVAEHHAASRSQERRMGTIGGLGNESIGAPGRKNDTIFRPPTATQASKSQTLARFTGGFR